MCKRPVYITVENRCIPVPCNKCEECLRNKTSDWCLRIQSMEADYELFFFTLTYREKNCPRNVYGDRIYSRRDLTLFKKNVNERVVRKLGFPRKSIKFIICPEYGPTNTHRPHYHGIMFIRRCVLPPYKGNSVEFSRFISRLKREVFTSWGRCNWRCFDFSWISKSNGRIGNASHYVAKYMSYGKFLPEHMFRKANHLFNYEFINNLLESYSTLNSRLQSFLFKTQHNIDSLLSSLRFDSPGDLEYSFLYQVFVCKYGRVPEPQELREVSKEYRHLRRTWFSIHYPSPFICASQGIGEHLLTESRVKCFDNILSNLLGYIYDLYVKGIDRSDEAKIDFHNLFTLRFADMSRRRVPKYVLAKYKITSDIGYYYSDILLKAVDLKLFEFDGESEFIDNSPPIDIYSRRDYIDYKNQHNIMLS
ncbi:replication initiator protein [Dipodfec virus UOA04_Rod_1032]|nr:replication initiator protein [Dipodfec virus UOA04_Rod_1032]